jgi:predicted CXXCH cytochrome family protein
MNEKPPTPRRGRRLTTAQSSVLAALLVTIGTIDAEPPPTLDPPTDNRACLRCHAMATLAYRDGTTGGLVDLFIDPGPWAGSVHGELACIKCHAPDFRYYPHPQSATSEQLDCVGCHRQDQERTDYPFQVIAGQYAESIHATSDDPKARGFGCYSCHDPHAFRVSKVGRPLVQIVRDDNRVCLSCHAEVRDPLRDLHQWLPNRDAHWAAVRCIECHTPIAGGDEAQRVSHRILPAKESNLTCVNCHSGNQRLLSRLYAYRSKEDLARDGLLAKAVFNEAYVVGMSRSVLIDRLSLILIGLTALGLIAHGFGRYRAYQRSRGN